jgi:hypothetical protein
MLNQQCKAKLELKQHNVHNVKVQNIMTLTLNPIDAWMDLKVKNKIKIKL